MDDEADGRITDTHKTDTAVGTRHMATTENSTGATKGMVAPETGTEATEDTDITTKADEEAVEEAAEDFVEDHGAVAEAVKEDDTSAKIVAKRGQMQMKMRMQKHVRGRYERSRRPRNNERPNSCRSQ